MRILACSLTALVLLVSSCGGPPPLPSAEYPETARIDHVDDYFGTSVPDPYRWFEDLDSEETAAWVEAQNAVSVPYLEALPRREELKERLTELWNYERFGVPQKQGGGYFFTRNDGLQDQDVLYVARSLEDEGRVLVDPNGFSADGTVALGSYWISPDGSLIAYGTADGGSDWQTYRFRDVDTGEDLEDVIRFTKFTSIAWEPDNKGFYYARYPEGPDGLGDGQGASSVYYHRLGTPQGDDELVFGQPENPNRIPGAYVTRDGAYLLIGVMQGAIVGCHVEG
ncbi:S9 family peptidase, partial [Gemmatimonadota bacterium]